MKKNAIIGTPITPAELISELTGHSLIDDDRDGAIMRAMSDPALDDVWQDDAGRWLVMADTTIGILLEAAVGRTST